LAALLWFAAAYGCEADAVSGRVGEPAQPAPAAPPTAEQPAPAAKQAPARIQAPASVTAERSFGAPFKLESAPLDVAQLLASPEPHLGKVVKCEGVVARVCERAGCWLELRAREGNGEGIRVPMAGHAFFIPQDAVGRAAVIEGQLTSRPLSDGERAHLESEGLKANGPISLVATSVVLR
jgi:hypothetical protein